MPDGAPKICSWPGCGALVRAGRCARHARQTEQERGTSAQRGYGRAWRLRRLEILKQKGVEQVRAGAAVPSLRGGGLGAWCEECLAGGREVPATDLHHRKDRRAGGGDEAENLQALCHWCHSRKTGMGKRESRQRE